MTGTTLLAAVVLFFGLLFLVVFRGKGKGVMLLHLAVVCLCWGLIVDGGFSDWFNAGLLIVVLWQVLELVQVAGKR